MDSFKFRTIYNFYDTPLNFTFTKEDEEVFFYSHMLATDEQGVDAYWVVKTNSQIIEDAEKRVIDLLTLLTSPEGEEEISLITTDGETMVLDLETAMLLYDDALPEPGTFLLNKGEEPHWRETDGEWL